MSANATETVGEGRHAVMIGALSALGDIAGDEERNWAISDFITENRSYFRRISTMIRVQYRHPQSVDDDVHQIVLGSFTRLVVDVATGKCDPSTIGKFDAYFMTRAKRAVTAAEAELDAEGPGFGGAAGVYRRRAETSKTRGLLTSVLQREPTADEVVAETNRKLESRRGNVVKQGMRVTLRDVQGNQVVSIDPSDDRREYVVTPDDTTPLHSVEAAMLMMLIVAECTTRDPLLGKVARLWVVPYLPGGSGDKMQAVEMAEILGIPQSTARAKRSQVQAVAKHICADRFGLTDTRASVG